jgi:Yip1 domain
MDNNFTNDLNSPSQNPEEAELSHTDKIAGIITEPVKTFETTAKFPVRAIDWVLPILLFALFLSLQQILYHSNPEISYQLRQKQMEAIDKNLNDAVESGKMTKDQADQQRNMIEDRMEKMGGIGLVFQIIGIFIVIFIIIFLMAAIYFLLAKFALKGDGSYSSVLVASGLSLYIGIIGVIVVTVISFLMGKLILDTSIASFVGADKSNIGGWLLAKLDIFTIWSYIVLGIGLAKMFKSSSIQKYIGLVLGVWIIGGLILFFLAKAIPFLKYFGV